VIILRKLQKYFPRTRSYAEKIDELLAKLIRSCEKEDLTTMASRYKDILSKKIPTLPNEPQVRTPHQQNYNN
jgi:hypothetical protein